jgi:hypothetical protein
LVFNWFSICFFSLCICCSYSRLFCSLALSSAFSISIRLSLVSRLSRRFFDSSLTSDIYSFSLRVVSSEMVFYKLNSLEIWLMKNSALSMIAFIQNSSMISFLWEPGGPESSKIYLNYSISWR